MEFHIKVLCILCMLMEQIYGFTVYSVSDKDTNLDDAKRSCNLATPKITDTTADFEHYIDMVEGEEAWIGYMSDQIVLEYIGCVELNVTGGLQLPLQTTKIDINLGECSVACSNYTYFGVMLTDCFCFNDLPTGNINKGRCQRTCDSPKDEAVCGGGTFVSMYTHAKNLTYADLTMQALEVHRGSCIMYDQYKRIFLPSKCTTAYKYSCQELDGQYHKIDISPKSWLAMANFCFGISMYPISYETTYKINGYQQIWTGMVTTRTFFTNIRDATDIVYAVYIVRESGEYRLRYTKLDEVNDEKRKYICQQDVSTLSKGMTTTPVTEPSTTERVQPLKQKDDSDVLLFVYIIVPVVVFCILLIVIVCICRRRRKGRKGHLDIDTSYTYHNHGHLHHSDMGSEFDDDSITLKHIEEHHDDMDYSNVPTLRISEKAYSNGTLQRKEHEGDSNGQCPVEEYEYSTIKKEKEKEANKKKRESFDPTYDTTKVKTVELPDTDQNSTYDKANYDEPWLGHDTETTEVVPFHDDDDVEIEVINQEGLSRF